MTNTQNTRTPRSMSDYAIIRTEEIMAERGLTSDAAFDMIMDDLLSGRDVGRQRLAPNDKVLVALLPIALILLVVAGFIRP